MNCNYPKSIKLFLAVLFFSIAAALPIPAETDPNPNSPTPVLLNVSNSKSSLSKSSLASKQTNRAVESNRKLVLYLTNLDLLPDEGANAFRVYIADSSGSWNIFPGMDLKLVDPKNQIYALFVDLNDETGNWKQPTAQGNMLVSVAWRGLESNRFRFNSVKVSNKEETEADAAPFSVKNNQTDVETNYVGYRWSGDRLRFLEQATFGPTDELDLRVRRIGLQTWLAEQFQAPYPSEANPYPNFSLKPTNPAPDCNGLIDGGVPDPDPFCFTNHYTMYPVQNWFYREAFYGNSQLRHRVTWALAQIWVLSGLETQQSRHMTEYHKVLSRNAFGNWRTLMREMTLNPGMGNYLNMRTSTKYTPNENFAREVLQLFNIGLFKLNQDGTLKLDNSGNPIPTYDQYKVNNFTAALTGWSLCERGGGQCPNRVLGARNFIDPMIVTSPENHDLTAKNLLNYLGSETTENIPACIGCTTEGIINYANNSLDLVLDNIYNHPNVAPFVSKLLIKQLVTGDPTPAYVGRVAAVFNANRSNATQLKEVIRAILLDPEARGDVKTDPRYGKLREPVQFLTNIARRFDVRSADRSTLSDGVLSKQMEAMGQDAFMSPSVFNFYQPDYTVPGTSFNGPEFGLLTSVTSVARFNFVNTIIFDHINVNAERLVTNGTSLSLAEMAALTQADPSGNRLMDSLNTKMMHGTMSPKMRSTILNVVATVPSSEPLLRAKRAVYLVATSSQFQVQR